MTSPREEAANELERLLQNPTAKKVGAICALAVMVAPPRSFLAISSDLIQIIVFAVALSAPIFVLMSTTTTTKHLIASNANGVSYFFQRLATMLTFMFAAGSSILLTKMVIAWAGVHGWHGVLDRALAGITGYLFGNFLVSASAGIQAMTALAAWPDEQNSGRPRMPPAQGSNAETPPAHS